MCEQPHGWMSFVCWLARAWTDYEARTLLLLGAAAVLAFLVGAVARLLRFFQMDLDDIRRLPRKEQLMRTIRGRETLTPDEPDLDR